VNRRKFLTTAGASMVSTTMIDLLPKAGASQRKHPSTSMLPDRPNIVLLICDDLGYGDLGCYGGALETPNLDKMALDGVLLTHCNTPHPTCSASRAAILTGRYASRSGVSRVFFPYDKGGMNQGTPTIASVLKNKDYHTAAIGKWHLGQSGDYLPHGFGFDEFYGVPYSVDMAPLPLIEGTKVIEENTERDSLTPRYTERALDVIKSAGTNPFFLYLAYSYPHIPIHASSRFKGKSRGGIYGDAVMEIDWSVGEIRKALREQGLEENTLIMFTSDHGPWYQGDPGRLKGRKDTDYEGGVRVPFLAAWKNHIPPGRKEEAFISTMDILPTVAELCKAPLPNSAIDGVNIWKVLAGQAKTSSRDDVVLYTSGDSFNIHCARLGRWKLRFAAFDVPPYVYRSYPRHSYTLAKPELYDLLNDPTESYDVAASHPDVVHDMLERVDNKLRTFPAEVQEVMAHQKAQVGSFHTSAGALPLPADTKFPPSNYMD
jgi:arylsulfatase A